MKCPVRHGTTISFKDWRRKPNAFRWACLHCRAFLKANRATWLCFFAALLFVTALLMPVVFIRGKGIVDA